MKHTVHSPVADYSGLIGRVMVHQGTADVDGDQYMAELRYMQLAGYTVDPPLVECGGGDDGSCPVLVSGDGPCELHAPPGPPARTADAAKPARIRRTRADAKTDTKTEAKADAEATTTEGESA